MYIIRAECNWERKDVGDRNVNCKLEWLLDISEMRRKPGSRFPEWPNWRWYVFQTKAGASIIVAEKKIKNQELKN